MGGEVWVDLVYCNLWRTQSSYNCTCIKSSWKTIASNNNNNNKNMRSNNNNNICLSRQQHRRRWVRGVGGHSRRPPAKTCRTHIKEEIRINRRGRAALSYLIQGRFKLVNHQMPAATSAPRVCVCVCVSVCVCGVPLFDCLGPLLLQSFRIWDNGSHGASRGRRGFWFWCTRWSLTHTHTHTHTHTPEFRGKRVHPARKYSTVSIFTLLLFLPSGRHSFLSFLPHNNRKSKATFCEH